MKVFVFYNGIDNAQILNGNPSMVSLSGDNRASLRTIKNESWSAEDRAEYGVYEVDIDPPENTVFTGNFEGLSPVYTPEPEPDLDAIWEQIKSIRQDKILGGGFPAVGKWFHSDLISRSQQYGLLLMGENIPEGLMWKTMDGTFIEMTPTVAQAIFQNAAGKDTAHFGYAEYLWGQVQQSESPLSIDIHAGWPETYQDTL